MNWNLDKLGRSRPHLIKIIQQLCATGADFGSLSENIYTTTVDGRLFIHLIGAPAEVEHTLIIERVKAGIAAAKRRGKDVGRPRKATPEQIAHACVNIDRGLQTHAGLAALLGIDDTTLRPALRASIAPQPYMATNRHVQGGLHGGRL